MMWDSTFLYIAAKLNDEHIWATLKQRDTIIFQNNNFEVFIDPDGDTHNYMELEINALTTVWDLLLLRPYREDTLPKVHDEWNMDKLQTAVHIEGSLNDPSDKDAYWSVEIALPLESITAPGLPHEGFTPSGNTPQHGEQWRINFSRVAWHTEVVDGRYVKKKDQASGKVPYFPQENWVWSASGRVAMHQPETWGYLQFSNNAAGEKEDLFDYKEEEIIKWGLRQLYFQERTCKKEMGIYSGDLNLFTIPQADIVGYDFQPEFVADSAHFKIRVAGPENKGYWLIRQDGKIWFEANHR